MGCDAWAWYAELAAIATKALALVTAYDETTANEEAMSGAALQFDDLLQVGQLLADFPLLSPIYFCPAFACALMTLR